MTAVSTETATRAEIVEPSFPATSGVKLLTSCRPWQLCYEKDAATGDPLHGLFTYFLLEGWAGKADEAAKGYVTLTDLYRYVDDKVKTWVATSAATGPLQTPTLSGEGGERSSSGRPEQGRGLDPWPGTRAACRFPARRAPWNCTWWPCRRWRGPAVWSCAEGDRREFRVGERVRIGCRANRDSYLYLLDVDAACQVVQLLPSAVWPDNRLRANQDHFLPGDHDRYDLPVQGPPGVETLIALATTAPAPVFGNSFPLRPRPVSEKDCGMRPLCRSVADSGRGQGRSRRETECANGREHQGSAAIR